MNVPRDTSFRVKIVLDNDTLPIIQRIRYIILPQMDHHPKCHPNRLRSNQSVTLLWTKVTHRSPEQSTPLSVILINQEILPTQTLPEQSTP